MSLTFREWRSKGRHLPAFMRDFHDQKDLFKLMDATAQFQNKDLREYSRHPDWIKAMTYTIDIFLWTMARYGYTLQPIRKDKFPVTNEPEDLWDLELALRDQRDRERDALHAVLSKR